MNETGHELQELRAELRVGMQQLRTDMQQLRGDLPETAPDPRGGAQVGKGPTAR